MLFRRDEPAWEVVDSKAVEPIDMYSDDDLTITALSRTLLTYMLPITLGPAAPDVRAALAHARALLQRAAARRGFNVLLTEGWRITLLRRGASYRLEVRYYGRPASVEGAVRKLEVPFVAMVDRWQSLGKAYVRGEGWGEEGEGSKTGPQRRSETATTQGSDATVESEGDGREKGCVRRLSRSGRTRVRRFSGFLGRLRLTLH